MKRVALGKGDGGRMSTHWAHSPFSQCFDDILSEETSSVFIFFDISMIKAIRMYHKIG